MRRTAAPPAVGSTDADQPCVWVCVMCIHVIGAHVFFYVRVDLSETEGLYSGGFYLLACIGL